MANTVPRPSDNVWTVDQAAEFVGLDPTTARNLMRKRMFPGAVKFGRTWRIARPAVMLALQRYGELRDTEQGEADSGGGGPART